MVECSRADYICLYLQAIGATPDGRAEPDERWTATGIADGLELAESAANRVSLLETLSQLERDGFLLASEQSIAGFDVPRTVYSLTAEGQEHATSVRQAVTDETVVVTNGTRLEVQLGEIDEYIEELPLVTALSRLTADGEVSLQGRSAKDFVNRTSEMKELQETIEQSFRRGCQTIVVSGDVGVGKSALVEECCLQLADDHDDLVVATGSCPPDVVEPFAAFRQAFGGLPGGGQLVDRIETADTAVTTGDPAGIQSQRTALFDEIAAGVRDIATQHHLVICIENLHWADETTLALLAHLATTIEELMYPIAFVCTFRESAVSTGGDPLESVLTQIEDEGAFTKIALDPLSRVNTRAVIAELTGSERPPASFVDLIYEHTGGNPLFVRETVTHLLETGVVDPTTETYPTTPEAVTLPAEVTDQIHERLAGLDAQSRELLELGGICGEQIPRAVLAAASNIPPETRREYVDLLVASNMWDRTSEPVAPAEDAAGESVRDGIGDDLRFVSGGLREAVLAQISAADRHAHHRRIAAAFEDVYGSDTTTVAARIAHHYDEAGDATKAIEFYRQAGVDALETYAIDDAIENLERGASLVSDDVADESVAHLYAELAQAYLYHGELESAATAATEGRRRAPPASEIECRLTGLQAEAASERGEYEAARDHTQDQLEQARSLSLAAREAAAIRRLGTVAKLEGDYETARDRLEECLDLPGVEHAPAVRLRALIELGIVHYQVSESEAGKQRFEDSYELALDLGDRYTEARSLHLLGAGAYFEGDYERAQDYYEQSLELRRRLQDRQGVAETLNALGLNAFDRGEYERATESLEESQKIRREIGDTLGQLEAVGNLALVARRRGNYELAKERHETSLDLASELGARHQVAKLHHNLGDIASLQGAYDEAVSLYERSLEIKDEIGDRRGGTNSRHKLGVIALRRGNLDEANTRFEDCLDTAIEIGDKRIEAKARYQLAVVARRREEYSAAQEELERARTLFAEMDDDFNLGKCALERGRLALAEGELDRATGASDEATASFGEIGATHWQGKATVLDGRIKAAQGDGESARTAWTQALETFETVGAPQDELETLQHLVRQGHNTTDESAVREWCARATDVLAEAPEPVCDQYREWFETQCPGVGG